MARYKYVKLRNRDIRAFIKIIYIFENFVQKLIHCDNFESLNNKELKSKVSQFLKSTNLKAITDQCFNNSVSGDVCRLLNELHL